ncbi:TIGR02996 domain-containing protein [Frigoriglobus tundricola]|uniref:TIGR02996 domain-containing protein n=1 Tax=Frigoriglobus tundricola TaxID=2774151 RepID=A0A6M5YT82_9BACT|nr:TIGR02996 domain-containing protein [Frigoriglobus tundricola]QJW96626.1 hypothetical protein FTUN_4183 [Frigoriglobus tundricola]
MSPDEAAFLKAIGDNPADETARLVYADWLAERGEDEKATWLRESVVNGWPQEDQPLYPVGLIQTMFSRGTLGDAWLHLVRGRIPLWDASTLLALGRLQGFLLANSFSNDRTLGFQGPNSVQHAFNKHTGEASLLPLGILDELVSARFAEYLPVNLEPLPDWESSLRSVFTRWLFTDPAGVVTSIGASEEVRTVRTDSGRRSVEESALRLVRAVIRPERAWQITVTKSHYYAMESNDIALEAANRVLFLHFSFSD